MSLKCAQNRGETTCTDTTSLKVCIFLLIDLISIMWLDESKVDSSMFGSFACLPFLSLSSKVRLTRVEEWISLDWLDEENVWYHKHQGKQQDKQTHLFFPSQTKRLTKRHPNVPFITSAFFFFLHMDTTCDTCTLQSDHWGVMPVCYGGTQFYLGFTLMPRKA